MVFNIVSGGFCTCNQNADTGTPCLCISFQMLRTVSVPPCIPTTAPEIIHSGSSGGLPILSVKCSMSSQDAMIRKGCITGVVCIGIEMAAVCKLLNIIPVAHQIGCKDETVTIPFFLGRSLGHLTRHRLIIPNLWEKLLQ